MMEHWIYPGRKGYRSPGQAKKYAERSPRRNAAEANLLRTLLQDVCIDGPVPRPRVLDAPSGTGRMADLLAEKGWEVTTFDISLAMLRHRVKTRIPFAAVSGEMERLPFRSESFDLVLCWRFFHHLPSSALMTLVLGELARVSRGWVILSFFHPLSLHNLVRRSRTLFTGNKGNRFTCTPRFLVDKGNAFGLHPCRWIEQPPLWREEKG